MQRGNSECSSFFVRVDIIHLLLEPLSQRPILCPAEILYKVRSESARFPWSGRMGSFLSESLKCFDEQATKRHDREARDAILGFA